MKFFKQLNKSDLLSILLLIVVNFIIKVPLTFLGFFAFAYDQGRDFLAVSRIIYEGNLTLIGPNTGLEGIFYGPSWYYLLSPILYLSGGDPQLVAIGFSLFGITTIILLFLLIKHLTSNTIIALSLALIASMSSSSGFGPINIWSPTIVPFLLIGFIFVANKIFSNPKAIYYFLFGFVTLLISDFGAAFGVVLILFMLLSPVLFYKYFFKKEYLLTLLGAVLAFLPRIVFDIRNNFLITNSIINYLNEPKVYGDQLPILSRLLQRLEQFYYVFAAAIARNNSYLLLVEIIIVISLLTLIYKRKKSIKITTKPLAIFLTTIIIFYILTFTVFPDIVWDYYLVGIPTLFIVLLALLLNGLISSQPLKMPIIAFLVAMTLINFNMTLIYPARITWLGDGATYRNPKMVIDYIASQNPSNYSIYTFSPAIFDPPMDYLISWYSRKKMLEKPKTNQDVFYLIIREQSTKQYLAGGWYGDKTRDNTDIVDSKMFPGDLLVEKHIRKNEQ